MTIEILFVIAALILSIIIHEVSHGYVAQMLGDPTARLAGRLTLNPLKHIDPVGSILIPGILVLTGAQILFGWAKPVPYNPYNLRNARWGEALVAGAGPLVNLFIAVVFGLLIRFSSTFALGDAFVQISSVIVYINILLALSNLIPIPPLDGSKVLKSILPFQLSQSYARFEGSMARYGLFAAFGFLFLFIFLLWPFFAALISFIFTLITGVSFFQT